MPWLRDQRQDIRDAISSKRTDLPDEMEEPVLERFDPTDEPIVSLSLTSETLSGSALTLITLRVP